MVQPPAGFVEKVVNEHSHMPIDTFPPLQDEIEFLCAPIKNACVGLWPDTTFGLERNLWQQVIEQEDKNFKLSEALEKLSELDLDDNSPYTQVELYEIEENKIKFLLKKNEDGLSLYEAAIIKNCEPDILTTLINNPHTFESYYKTQNDANIAQGPLGLTPLMIAIFFQRQEVVQSIIRSLYQSYKSENDQAPIKGIFSDVTKNGWNVLMLAFHYKTARRSIIKLFKLLSVDNRIEILKKQNNQGNNLLMLQAHHDLNMLPKRISQLKELLEGRSEYLNAFLTATNKNNQTMFDLLSEKSDKHMCDFLEAIKLHFPTFDLSNLKPELPSTFSFFKAPEKIVEPSPPKPVNSSAGETYIPK